MKYAATAGTPVFACWSLPFAGSGRDDHPAVSTMVRALTAPGQSAATIAANLMASAAAAGVDDTPGVWCIHPQNLTSGQFGGVGPESAGLDPLAAPAPYTPAPPECSMFVANGVAATAARVAGAMNALLASWTTAGYAPLACLAHDDEDVISYAGTQCPVVGTTTPPTPEGAWVPSLTDARAATELVAPGRTLAAWEAERTAAGVTFDNAASPFTTQNFGFLSWHTRAGRKDWLMDACIYQAMRARWPGIVCGNYDCFTAPVSAPVLNPLNEILQQAPQSLLADYASPFLYPPDFTKPATIANMLPGETQSAYYRRRSALTLASCAAASAKPIIPWLLSPGESVSWSTYVPTVADVFNIWLSARSIAGITRAFLFSSAPSAARDAQVSELVGMIYTGSRSKVWLRI